MPDELYSPVALLIRSAWNGIGIRRASDLFEKVFAIDEKINGAPPDESDERWRGCLFDPGWGGGVGV